MVGKLHLLVTLGALSVSAYLLGLPMLRDRAGRGDYLFGQYGLKEIYVGFPALLVAIVALAVWLVPAAGRNAARAKALALTVSLGIALFGLDLVFALVLRGAAAPDFWLDGAHIARGDNLPDDELGFVRRPGVSWTGPVRGTDRVVTYAVDERGFHNPPGTVAGDLAFVGDSYTESAQVAIDEAFPARVAKLLERSSINLGRGAYGPQQERAVLERFALTQEPEPRAVVWQLFEGNDLKDAQEYQRWRAGDWQPVALLDRYFQNSLFRPLLDATLVPRAEPWARLTDDGGAVVPLNLRYDVERDAVTARAEGWAATAAALRAGAASCRTAGVPLVVVFVPIAARVWAPRLEFTDPAKRERYLPDGHADDRAFAAALRALCAELEVPFVDLLPPLLAARDAGRTDLYLPIDEHFDLGGHEVVAAAIAAVLQGRI